MVEVIGASIDVVLTVTFCRLRRPDHIGPAESLLAWRGTSDSPNARRPVIGIDSSPAMLVKARVAAGEAVVALDLCEGDLRDFEPAEPIYCPFRSLLHLPAWPDRRRTFERVAGPLRPDGRFAWTRLR